jgi:hypothetical protein
MTPWSPLVNGSQLQSAAVYTARAGPTAGERLDSAGASLPAEPMSAGGRRGSSPVAAAIDERQGTFGEIGPITKRVAARNAVHVAFCATAVDAVLRQRSGRRY